jgi:hypothetical protein
MGSPYGRSRFRVFGKGPDDLSTVGGDKIQAMEFSRELRNGVLSGEITVSFRLWHRPQAKPGGRYRVGAGLIEVDTVELVPFSSITLADVRRSGETDLDSLRRRAAHAGPITAQTLLYRLEFHPAED